MNAAMSFDRGRYCLSRAATAASTMGARLKLRLINPTNNTLQGLFRKLRVGREGRVAAFLRSRALKVRRCIHFGLLLGHDYSLFSGGNPN
jgi:hypothetical protein